MEHLDDDWWMQDDEPTRIAIFLRLLYSRSFEKRIRRSRGVPQNTVDLLTTIDWSALRIERQARHRNLKFAIRRTCGILCNAIDPDELTKQIRPWCDSEDFWSGEARCLDESFCVHCFRNFSRRGDDLIADIARLQGVCAGLRSAPRTPTPWNGTGGIPEHVHREDADDGSACEEFLSSQISVDESSALRLTSGADVSCIRVRYGQHTGVIAIIGGAPI